MKFTFDRVPLAEAIAFFQEKVNIPTDGWGDLAEIEHTVAFTIAGLKAELLAEARDIMDKLIIEGQSIDVARQEFRRIITDRGWLADKTKKQQAYRVDLVIDTNLKTSNAIGRYEAQNDPDVVSQTPYYLYRHGDSVVPRPTHKALDGVVYKRNDPRAKDLYAPRGFRCSCLNFVISEREYQKTYAGTDKDFTGGVPNEITVNGKELSTDADKGFQNAPFMPSSDRRAELVARISDRLPDDVKAQFLADITKIDSEYEEEFSAVAAVIARDRLGRFASKASGAISQVAKTVRENKGKIATEIAVAATGMIASNLGANPAQSTLAGTTTRAAIAVGKVFHDKFQAARAKDINGGSQSLLAVAKQAGLDTISQLKEGKFQKNIEKGFFGDFAGAATSNLVTSLLSGTPLGALPTGDAVAMLDPAKVADNSLRAKKLVARAIRNSKEGNIGSAVEGAIMKRLGIEFSNDLVANDFLAKFNDLLDDYELAIATAIEESHTDLIVSELLDLNILNGATVGIAVGMNGDRFNFKIDNKSVEIQTNG